MDNEKLINLLNTLLEINIDRIKGYELALKETKDLDLINLFTQLIKTSQNCKLELVYEIRKMGGIPIEGIKSSDKIFKLWKELKTKIDGWNRKAILNLCEYVEDLTVDSYDKTLRDNLKLITTEQQSLLNVQHLLIKKDHITVKALRDKIL